MVQLQWLMIQVSRLITLGILLLSLGLALVFISIALFLVWRVHKKNSEKQHMSKHEYDTIILGTRGQSSLLFSKESHTTKDGSTTSQNIIRTTNAEIFCENQSSFDPFEGMYHTIGESDISQKCITYRNDNLTLSAESSSSRSTMPPSTYSPSPCTSTKIPVIYVNQAESNIWWPTSWIFLLGMMLNAKKICKAKPDLSNWLHAILMRTKLYPL